MSDSTSTTTTTTTDRLTKLTQLRKKMAESATANRKDLIAESNTTRSNQRSLLKLERKRQQLEAMGEKQQAQETGQDLERKRAWEYSIEESEAWDKKLARKGRRVDAAFTDYDDLSRKQYRKNIDEFKPDYASYNAQRSKTSSSNNSAAIIAAAAASGSVSKSDREIQEATDDLYRDAHSFVYADHVPSEDAIDRVVGKINLDLAKRAKFSRERPNEVEGDITYINEKNRLYNKKLERFFQAHTQEVRESFERGTAL